MKGATPIPHRLSTERAVGLPLAFAVALASLVFLPSIAQDPTLVRIFLGAAGTLAIWAAVLYVTARRGGRSLEIQLVLRKPHYVQMTAQGTVLLYWGWHVPAVYDFGPFILAQILFAFGVDSLLNWSRRDKYGIGVGLQFELSVRSGKFQVLSS